MNVNFKDLEELKAHVSSAVVRDMEDKIKPLLGEIKAALAEVPSLKTDVAKLKANQAKALVGWTVFVAGATLLFNHARTWVQIHILKSDS